MKQERLLVFTRFVEDLAAMSRCSDKGVAAIILDKEGTQVFSIGINGGPKGGIDCLCELGQKYTCAHAEMNALAKCTTDCTGKVMICTLAPCITCATLIVNVGISKVYVLNTNGHDDGLKILRAGGVKVEILRRKERAKHGYGN